MKNRPEGRLKTLKETYYQKYATSVKIFIRITTVENFTIKLNTFNTTVMYRIANGQWFDKLALALWYKKN